MKPDAQWPLPDRLPALAPGAVHVWRATLTQPEAIVKALAGHLSPEEEFRACGYQRDVDRRRFITCRGLLRRLVGAYLSLAPGQVAFVLGQQAKPRLMAGPDTLDLRFNVSHCGDLALFALAVGREVGVDLERVRPLVEAGKIVEQFFSPREKALLAGLPEPARLETFFRCWTRKEAYVKARACEPDLDLTAIDVDCDVAASNALIGPDASRWGITPLSPGTGYIGALAVEGGTGAVARFHLAAC